jgi:hypothetical protein
MTDFFLNNLADALPFLFRYDLHYGGDPAIGYLMELRILGGDRPIYFYGQDYMGALEPYLGAGLMKIFGPSIPLASALGLAQWSVAVALFIYIFTLSTSKFEGFIAGAIATVGVPFTLTYTTQPFTGNNSDILIVSLILLAGFFILTRGGGILRFALLGFTMGLGLFLNEQSVVASAACLLALFFMRTPAWNRWVSFRPSFVMALITGALIGDAPGLWYKSQHVQPQSLFAVASPYFMYRNIECALKCVLAYFDAHPISRVPDGIYFWLNVPFNQIPPHGFWDILFSVVAAAVLVFNGFNSRDSLRKGNPGLFIFSSLVWLNLLALIMSAHPNADTVNARRYLTGSAVVFSLWTAYSFTRIWEKYSKPIRIAVLGLLVVFLGRVVFHDIQQLRAPDQLREMRWALGEMKTAGLNRGLADWPFGSILTSLADQQIIVADWPSPEKIPEYRDEALSTDRIAVIKTNQDNLDKVVEVGDRKYRLDGFVVKNETFWMAPYSLIK